MSSKANVTTPGGFFVGLGGIVSFCVVAAGVFWWVQKTPPSEELSAQQVALGLRAGPDVKGADLAKKEAEVKALVAQATKKYNGNDKLDINRLDDLRGVVRYREANKSREEAAKALNGEVAWKDKAKGEVTMPIALAVQAVGASLKDRKPKPSAVKIDIMPPADPSAVPMMPNAMLGGAKTVFFTEPTAAATPAPAPETKVPAPEAKVPSPEAKVPAPEAKVPAPETKVPAPEAKVPAPEAKVPAPETKVSAPVPAAVVPKVSPEASPATAVATGTGTPAPVSNRPALLNWPETKK